MNKKIFPEKIMLFKEDPHWCVRREIGIVVKEMFDLLMVHHRHKKFTGTSQQYKDLMGHFGSAYSIIRVACARFHQHAPSLKGIQKGIEEEREAIDIPGIPLQFPIGTLLGGDALEPVNRNMNDHSEPSTSQ